MLDHQGEFRVPLMVQFVYIGILHLDYRANLLPFKIVNMG